MIEVRRVPKDHGYLAAINNPPPYGMRLALPPCRLKWFRHREDLQQSAGGWVERFQSLVVVFNTAALHDVQAFPCRIPEVCKATSATCWETCGLLFQRAVALRSLRAWTFCRMGETNS